MPKPEPVDLLIRKISISIQDLKTPEGHPLALGDLTADDNFHRQRIMFSENPGVEFFEITQDPAALTWELWYTVPYKPINLENTGPAVNYLTYELELMNTKHYTHFFNVKGITIVGLLPGTRIITLLNRPQY